MVGTVLKALRDSARGVGRAVRTRPGTFLAAVALVFGLSVFLPPAILSIVRKPVDYFTFNPWLKRLPEYLASEGTPLGTKLEKTWDLALFWFSADNPYGVEWGFAVTAADLFRFLVLSLLVGAYFALWFYRRERLLHHGWGARMSGQGGTLGGLSGVIGLSTGPCTVVGCGAPVIPVLGLAFVGLSSTTLKWMAQLSTVATNALLLGLVLGVGYFGWTVGRAAGDRRP